MFRLVFMIVFTLLINHTWAAERKSISEIYIEFLLTETQVTPIVGYDHAAFVWWLPNEFWEVNIAQEGGMTEIQKQAMRDAMSGISIFGIVQGDISPLGPIKFYDKDSIEKNLVIDFKDSAGNTRRLELEETIDSDLALLLSVMRPALAQALGNMGENLHFYIVNNQTSSSTRLLDPYQAGLLNIHLMKKNGDLILAQIEMPLNSLYVPRKCPNGKDAHISWNYCPWSGERLEN